MINLTTPNTYNSKILVNELNNINFFNLLINKSRILVKDAEEVDRASIQAVLDNHNPNALTKFEQSKVNLLSLDLNATLNPQEVGDAIKNIIRVMKKERLLE